MCNTYVEGKKAMRPAGSEVTEPSTTTSHVLKYCLYCYLFVIIDIIIIIIIIIERITYYYNHCAILTSRKVMGNEEFCSSQAAKSFGFERCAHPDSCAHTHTLAEIHSQCY